MAYANRFKKSAKKVYKKVVRPYVKRKGGYNNRMKLYKEITAIKKMINAEKKTKALSVTGASVGQLFNAAEGAYVASITPSISTGVGFNERNGRSIRCSGMYFRGQFTAQTNTINSMKFTMTILKVVGYQQTTTQILTGMYNTDPISGFRDYYASRNPDQYTDYRVLAERTFYLPPDQLTGQASTIDFKIPLKLNHHIRYDLNTTNILEGEIFVFIRADKGDCGVPLTGCFLQWSTLLSYYDN